MGNHFAQLSFLMQTQFKGTIQRKRGSGMPLLLCGFFVAITPGGNGDTFGNSERDKRRVATREAIGTSGKVSDLGSRSNVD